MTDASEEAQMTATSRRLPGTIALAFSVLLVGSLPSLTLTSCGASTMPAWAAATSPNQPASDNALLGVAADSASDVWAVGYDTPTTTGLTPTLVEHYNGSNWTIVTSANVVGGSNKLTGVAALSASDVWAVGNYTSGSGLTQPLIEHYDGSTWSLVGSLHVAGSYNYLTGVAAVSATDVWAVGYYSAPGSPAQPLIEHYDGTTWSLVGGASLGPVACILSGVAVVPATSALWAVGNCTTSNGLPQPLTEYYDGTSWSSYPGASTGLTGAVDGNLHGVAADSANDVWAVGYDTANVFQQTLVERWTGTTGTYWTLVASPNSGAYQNELLGVAAASASDVWAVGYYDTTANGLNDQPLIEHYDGHTWSIVTSPNSPIEDNYLTGVAVVPATVPAHLWAVGYYGHGSTSSPYQTFVLEH
jgi:hypothetical protein